MQRFWTADFHLGMTDCLRFDKRGIAYGGLFKNIDDMNNALLKSCMTANEDDIIIHVGDLASFKTDRGSKGLQVKPSKLLECIPASFINIRGNHDLNNKVKSLCDSMRVHLGRRFPDVSVSHYPSYDKRAEGHFNKGDIHICGHVHGKWKHCLDVDNSVLNINVGVDANGYRIISEEELIKYIDSVLKLPYNKINKVQRSTISLDGKTN